MIFMGQILREVFQEKLLYITDSDLQCGRLPSPESTKNMVIVKNRVPGKIHKLWMASFRTESPRSTNGICSCCCSRHGDGEESLSAEEVAGLLEYTRTSSLVAPSKKCKINISNVESYEEKVAFRMVSKYGDKHLSELHNECLARVFPDAKRFVSSNPDPMPLWLAGFQMVAINYQTADFQNIVYDGFFQQNGGSGYVLKPHPILTASAKYMLVLTILSGHSFPTSEIEGVDVNPMVRVSIHGVKQDCNAMTTSPVTGNGLNPRWMSRFQFEITQPGVAILVFQAFHVSTRAREKLIASAAFPVIGLRKGLRWVPLRSLKHRLLADCGLLVEVQFDESWTELDMLDVCEQSSI